MITLNHDGQLDIAVGRSREEKRWQNKEMKWSEFVDKVSKTHRTAETYEEYMKSKPARQDIIKDIGGYVGGIITGGRRRNGSIVSRQLLTLDLDYAPGTADFWDNVMLMDCAAVAYSTHKHSIATPRLRLLIPLSRPVSPIEYEAIARKVASHIDIEWFDPTTFQPTRLMYWPSSSKDGEFYTNCIDEKWLDADVILAQYKDWQDEGQWPLSSKARDKVKSAIAKQGDPLVKSGIVGAFCRTHTVESAIIKYLSDIYVESNDGSGRFTYAKGSTANGLVVYDDIFAYSHHSTDPVSERLCNAFDLVRLHKFGYLDEKTDEKKVGAQAPSYVAMTALASEDKGVLRTIGEEKLAEAREAFADLDSESEYSDLLGKVEGEWMEGMEVDKNGNYTQTINNALLIFENDPGFKAKFRYNLFEHRVTLEGDLPWRKVTPRSRHLIDADLANIRHYMELIYGITSLLKIEDALTMVSRRNQYHPITDWLDELIWDGEARAERIFIDYMGAEPSSYVKAVTRKSLLACVTRVYEPGCKFDELVVEVGDQGIGKSTILKRLGHKWFSDSLVDIRGKEALEQLQGAWIIEFGELSSLRKAEVDQFKHFASKQEDRFRVAYGKLIQDFPRQCVFFGTTNDDNFLKDLTGNRRFWPVKVNQAAAYKDIFSEFTHDVVKQIWAEVMGWYMSGESLRLPAEVEAAAKAAQSEHLVIDDRIGALAAYLERPLPIGWKDMLIYDRRTWLTAESDEPQAKGVEPRQWVSAAEIWCELLGGQMKDLNSYASREVHGLMRRVGGWRYTKKYKRLQAQYGRQTIWEREAS